MPFLPPVSKPPSQEPRRKRQTTNERGYGPEHRALRLVVLAEEPICTFCHSFWSEHMHHHDGNTFNRERTNVCGICAQCHYKHHHQPTT